MKKRKYRSKYFRLAEKLSEEKEFLLRALRHLPLGTLDQRDRDRVIKMITERPKK